jgi:predicted amidophosphoribosyltransferase
MQRNGQNPVKAVKSYDHSSTMVNEEAKTGSKTANIAGICSACQTAVPLKPGFRASSLKCPKCGKPLGKK